MENKYEKTRRKKIERKIDFFRDLGIGFTIITSLTIVATILSMILNIYYEITVWLLIISTIISLGAFTKYMIEAENEYKTDWDSLINCRAFYRKGIQEEKEEDKEKIKELIKISHETGRLLVKVNQHLYNYDIVSAIEDTMKINQELNTIYDPNYKRTNKTK